MNTRVCRIAFATFGLLCALVAPMPVWAQLSATNGILTVLINDTGSLIGQFTIRTGASHPRPNETVFYPTGTSYITLRDNTAQEIWANAGGTVNTNIAPYTFRSMQSAPATALVTTIPGGFRTTYTLPNWVVVQDVVISGTTLANTNVRQSVTVTNTSGVARSYGVRYMWDWEIAGNDASLFRTRNPDGAFTSTFIGYNAPAFQAFEEVDNVTTPTFSVFGTVAGGSLVPPPTAPDRLGYVDWSDYYDAPWDFPISGAGVDSATVHFWGFTTPLSIAPGGSATYTEYVSTVQSAIGVGPGVAAPQQIPTLSQWALIALAMLVGLIGIRSRRAM